MFFIRFVFSLLWRRGEHLGMNWIHRCLDCVVYHRICGRNYIDALMFAGSTIVSCCVVLWLRALHMRAVSC